MPESLDFVIVSYGRSGSHMLADALTSHPHVAWCHDKHARDAFDKERFDVRHMRRELTGLYGCSVHYSAWKYFSSGCDKSNIKFIHLVRDLEDVSRSVLRYKRMKRHGINVEKYELGDDVPEGWNVEPKTSDLLRQMNHVRVVREKMRTKLSYLTCLEVAYEDLTNHEEVYSLNNLTAHELQAYLGLEPTTLRTTVKRGVSRYDG